MSIDAWKLEADKIEEMLKDIELNGNDRFTEIQKDQALLWEKLKEGTRNVSRFTDKQRDDIICEEGFIDPAKVEEMIKQEARIVKSEKHKGVKRKLDEMFGDEQNCKICYRKLKSKFGMYEHTNSLGHIKKALKLADKKGF